jgi:hypothetical protein
LYLQITFKNMLIFFRHNKISQIKNKPKTLYHIKSLFCHQP